MKQMTYQCATVLLAEPKILSIIPMSDSVILFRHLRLASHIMEIIFIVTHVFYQILSFLFLTGLAVKSNKGCVDTKDLRQILFFEL